MKKLLFTILIGLSFTITNGQTKRYDTIRYAREYYAERVAVFNKESIKKNRIIFLGNSIVEFGDWKKLLEDSTVINRGIAADNSFGVLDRLEDVAARHPSKLFVEIGNNDIQQEIPAEITVKNINVIIERVRTKSPKTKIFIHSVLPVNDNVKENYPEAYGKNPQIDLLNQQLMNCAKMNKVTYVELNKELMDKAGKLDEKYARPDGLHLNEFGYQVWVNFLKTKKYL